ncbi:hypothetical protein N431DRAFT_198732 [Stipitochalara longipes BDJ]|nr:hypothetical protein N431DRAFT_198732 [Stipitochalara longipes BDJ]
MPIARTGASQESTALPFGHRARFVGAGNLTASSRASCSNFSVTADFAHSSAPPLTRLPRLSHEPRPPHDPNCPELILDVCHKSFPATWQCRPTQPAVAVDDRLALSLGPLPARSFVPRQRPLLLTSFFPHLPSTRPGLYDRPGTCGSLPAGVRCPCANCTAVIPSLAYPALQH